LFHLSPLDNLILGANFFLIVMKKLFIILFAGITLGSIGCSTISEKISPADQPVNIGTLNWGNTIKQIQLTKTASDSAVAFCKR
jgi:hypothetical protein